MSTSLYILDSYIPSKVVPSSGVCQRPVFSKNLLLPLACLVSKNWQKTRSSVWAMQLELLLCLATHFPYLPLFAYSAGREPLAIL